MKKKYITPHTLIQAVHTNYIIATSGDPSPNHQEGNGIQFSNKDEGFNIWDE